MAQKKGRAGHIVVKKHLTLLLLLAFMALSLYLRVIPPYDQVFAGEWIKFTSVDAYWQMEQVDRIAPDFPHYAGKILQIPFFHWLLSAVIWVVGLGSPTQHTIDTVGVYFPAVLGALTIIPVYFLGKVMFGELAGIVGAGLIAVLPGEWLGRSSLGFTDHHVAEVLLTTTALMFLVLALDACGKRRIIYGLLAGLFFSLYWLTWPGAVLFVVILAVFLLVYCINTCFSPRKIAYLGVIGILVSGVVAGVTAVVFYGYYAEPLLPFTGYTALATMELESLTLLTAWQNFGFITFFLPIILIILVHQAVKHGDAGTILLLVWSTVIMVIMLEYLRFAYYFAVNASLLTGWFIWYAWQKLAKQNVQYAVLTVAILCVLILIPNVQQATASKNYHTPSDAWCDTLAWVKDNTPQDSIILSWWDYGYWINRIADRKAYITPGQHAERITDTAHFFLSPNGDSDIDFDYLILDYPTTTSKFRAITIWAGKTVGDYYRYDDFFPVRMYYTKYYQTLIVRLYTGEPVGQYALVYQSEQEIQGTPEVNVFYKRKIIDGQ